MLFSNRNKPRKNGDDAHQALLAQYGHLERRAAEIAFKRNAIITHTERHGLVDARALTYLAQYGVSAVGKERAAEIARNLELSGTCLGLADCILAL